MKYSYATLLPRFTCFRYLLSDDSRDVFKTEEIDLSKIAQYTVYCKVSLTSHLVR